MDNTAIRKEQLLIFFAELQKEAQQTGDHMIASYFENAIEHIQKTSSENRIYKVFSAEYVYDQNMQLATREYDVLYFSSLNAAKKEHQRRVETVRQAPNLADFGDIIDARRFLSIAPEEKVSIIDNTNFPIREDIGRFRFCEARLKFGKRIEPLLVVLTEVIPQPSGARQQLPGQNVIDMDEIRRRNKR